MKLSFEEAMEAVRKEREHQDDMWGTLDERQQSVAGYCMIVEHELTEAKLGWAKNIEGKHSALAEMVQVAATAIACIQQHGTEGNPM